MAKNKQSTKRTPKSAVTKKRKNDSANPTQKSSLLVRQTPVLLGAFAGIILLFFQDHGKDTLTSLWTPSNAKHKEDPMLQCGLVMANSSLPHGDWGMFTLNTIQQGSSVAYGSPIVHIPDLAQHQASAIQFLLHRYLWGGNVFGGSRGEGKAVYSFLPGIGSLANGHPTEWNMAPVNWPRVDAATARRGSPGTGAFTHYHGLTFHAYGKDLLPGEEILVNYGRGWTHQLSSEKVHARKDVQELRKTGHCLDHIGPGVSTLPDAGRGAFAMRYLPKNTMVAPVPLIPINNREVLKMKDDKTQLLLNYCFGHPNSTLLLLPYSTVVSLVNHGGKTNANVKLQWSDTMVNGDNPKLQQSLLDITDRQPHGLLMEFVALRDIHKGEEILLDYGPEWELAWEDHKRSWEPPAATDEYVYVSEFDQATPILQVPSQLMDTPYPKNVQTTCFYSYDPNHHNRPVRWERKPDTFLPPNLFPCDVLSHNETVNDYTVRMRPSPSLLSTVQIPADHIVEGVPRGAVRFQDVLDSTDQQLKGVFRHEIGIPSSIMPPQWRV